MAKQAALVTTVLSLIDAEIEAAKSLRGAGGGSSRRLQAAGAVTALRALRTKVIEALDAN